MQGDLLQTKLKRWQMNLLASGCGVLLALLLIAGVLLAFPQLRYDPRSQLVRFTVGIGDMFITRHGVIAPPANPYEVLAEYRLAYDDDGFRVPERPADLVEVVALGDSYTEAGNAARPWPDVLAAASGLSVRNLGFRGYGPVEEARVLQDYGMPENPRLIIVGYFEGNDLSNVLTSEEFIEPRAARQQFTPFDPTQPIWLHDNPPPYQLPVRVEINGTVTEMALLDDYLSWLNGTIEDYAQSANMRALETTWRTMLAAAGDTCVVITYFPTAPHLYLPYLIPEDRDKFMATVQGVGIAAPNEAITYTGAISYEESILRLNNQRDAVAGLAAQLGIPFIDLVPAFEAAAANGDILYYAYDTHWNQAGHDLAGQVIAAYLAQQPNPCA
jgi:hypothetical protein